MRSISVVAANLGSGPTFGRVRRGTGAQSGAHAFPKCQGRNRHRHHSDIWLSHGTRVYRAGSGLPLMAAVEESELVVTVVPPVLILKINRPSARNAITKAVAEGIAAALDRLDSFSDLAVAVITGVGGNFCAGMDLKRFALGELPKVPGRSPNSGPATRYSPDRRPSPTWYSTRPTLSKVAMPLPKNGGRYGRASSLAPQIWR